MKVHRVMQGEWDSCLFSRNSYHPFSAHFSSPALPLRSCRQQKQGRDVCDVSPLLSVLLTGNKPLDFCIYTCVVSVIGSLKLLLKNSSFFQKYTWTADLDRHSFLSVFLLYFTFLILEFLKKTVIRELRTRKNGLIKRFSRVGPIITHSRESSNSQRDPQDHAHS